LLISRSLLPDTQVSFDTLRTPQSSRTQVDGGTGGEGRADVLALGDLDGVGGQDVQVKLD